VLVGLHIAAMYAASPLFGRLADRFGPARLAAVGGPCWWSSGACRG
jgi:MFS family permease